MYNGLWTTYTNDVESARKLATGSIMHMINDLPSQTKQVNGDLATLALNNKFVDGLKTRDELRELMIQHGVKDRAYKKLSSN